MTRQAVAIIDPITTQVAELAAHEVERARESQEQAEATYQATRWRVLGIAAIPDDAADADILIRAADRALYAAKGNGRNRVELFISPARSARTPA